MRTSPHPNKKQSTSNALLSLLNSLGFATLRCLEKVPNIFSQRVVWWWWIPWYKVKNHLKQIQVDEVFMKNFHHDSTAVRNWDSCFILTLLPLVGRVLEGFLLVYSVSVKNEGSKHQHKTIVFWVSDTSSKLNCHKILQNGATMGLQIIVIAFKIKLVGAEPPTLLLICSSFSRKGGYPLLICSSLSTAQ